MKKKLIAFALIWALGGVAGMGFTEENPIAAAITYTQAAIEYGEMGYASILVEQAEAALKYADLAEKAKQDPHVEQGIVYLQAAIDSGKKGDAKAATDHAKQALDHLQQAGK